MSDLVIQATHMSRKNCIRHYTTVQSEGFHGTVREAGSFLVSETRASYGLQGFRQTLGICYLKLLTKKTRLIPLLLEDVVNLSSLESVSFFFLFLF